MGSGFSIRARRSTAAQQLALLQVKREISATDPHGRFNTADIRSRLVGIPAHAREPLCHGAAYIAVRSRHGDPNPLLDAGCIA